MANLSCPVCGNRGRSDDLNHFERRGNWQRRPVLMCRVCGSGLMVGSGLLGSRARRINPEQWARMVSGSKLATDAPEADTPAGDPSPKSQVESPPEPAGVMKGLQALNDEIVAALEAMRRLPITANDTRAVGVYKELMTALVWTKDLLIESRAALRDGSSARSHFSKGEAETQM